MIDLCSADGMCKYLFKDLEGNGKKYFDKREFCHVVIVRRKLRTSSLHITKCVYFSYH